MEVGSWSINISDDTESLDKEDASFEDDNKSVNGVETNLEELDDLDDIMKPLEEHICDDNMNIEDDHVEDVSDDNRPPGFENATYCHNKVPTSSQESKYVNVIKVLESREVPCNTCTSDGSVPPGDQVG